MSLKPLLVYFTYGKSLLSSFGDLVLLFYPFWIVFTWRLSMVILRSHGIISLCPEQGIIHAQETGECGILILK